MQRAIGYVISAGLADPRIRGLVSVTSVEVTADMRQAIVKISVLPAENASRVIHGLRSASPYIHSEVGRRIDRRHIPKLRFEIDESLKKQAAVLDAIRQAVDEDGLDAEDATAADDLPSESEDSNP